ncbi:MAG: TerB family tellurite resistance protein [Gammaproteobacteria bacterium]
MHIIIGLLTAVAGLFFAVTALQNSGAIDALNPFLWYRRAQWRKKLATKPIYALDKPIDVAALLILGVAKCEGEISKEQKQEILRLFKNEFRLSDKEAQSLFRASAFLMKDEVSIAKNVDKILERSQSEFTPAQVDSMLAMMRRISSLDGAASEEQLATIQNTDNYFSVLHKKHKGWN